MNITIIGASAGVGLACTTEALARGHQVTTLSRRVDTLPAHPALTVRQGSATQADDLRAAITGANAVLVTLGTGSSIKPTTLYTDFATALLEARDALGDAPLIVLTGFGASESAAYHGWLTSLLFRLFLKDVYADKSVMEGRLVASDLNWMLVRPGVLTNGAPSGPPRVQTDYVQGMKVGSIPRRTVARFMVAQAEQPTYLHQKPALSAR
ncbi:MAG: NAD(P)H-binding protein [Proteobacteria bacterium]|nr:NAD(P)H-binding protein [Pseudomonadota bacterium]